MLRLILAYDGPPNAEAISQTLNEFVECPNCSANVVMELVHVLVGMLNGCAGDWRTALAGRLAELLDEMADSDHP